MVNGNHDTPEWRTRALDHAANLSVFPTGPDDGIVVVEESDMIDATMLESSASVASMRRCDRPSSDSRFLVTRAVLHDLIH